MVTQSKEAPGDLEIVRAFVNSLDMDKGVEELTSPPALRTWLREHDLLEKRAAADDTDLRQALELRESLRAMLLTNNDGRSLDPAAAAVMDEVAGCAALRLRVFPDGTTHLVPESGGVDGALGRLLVIVYRSMETGTWGRLKACRDDTCQWAFYDHSRNGSAHWCSMDACGSRSKARAYRQRRHASASAGLEG